MDLGDGQCYHHIFLTVYTTSSQKLQPSGTLRACPGLYRDCFTFTCEDSGLTLPRQESNRVPSKQMQPDSLCVRDTSQLHSAPAVWVRYTGIMCRTDGDIVRCELRINEVLIYHLMNKIIQIYT